MQTQNEINRLLKDITEKKLRCWFGVSVLDDALRGMTPSGLTLIGARTGGGKTEFATQVVLEQQDFEKGNAKSVLYFALDHEKGEIERRVLWRLLVKQARRTGFTKPLRFAEWMAGEYQGLFDELEGDADSHIRHVFALSETTFVYDKATSFDSIIKAIEGGAREYNLFIIDHFHAIPMPVKGDERLLQKNMMARLCAAAELAERPVLLLGQFRKRGSSAKVSPIPDMEEFAGSANMIYVPQNIVTLAPRITADNQSKGETYFAIEKCRNAPDAKGYIGVHSFDIENKSYSRRYEIMRTMPFGEPLTLEPHQYPTWAKGASSVMARPTKQSFFSKSLGEKANE